MTTKTHITDGNGPEHNPIRLEYLEKLGKIKGERTVHIGSIEDFDKMFQIKDKK